jgi:hypothetical protein
LLQLLTTELGHFQRPLTVGFQGAAPSILSETDDAGFPTTVWPAVMTVEAPPGADFIDRRDRPANSYGADGGLWDLTPRASGH